MSEIAEAGDGALTEQAFAIFQAYKGMARAAHEARADKPLSYAEIVHYVMGHDNIDLPRVTQGLKTRLSERRVYQQLLDHSRCAWAAEEARADDSGELRERCGQGFTLKFSAAKHRPAQIYVILQLDYHNLIADDRPLILHASSDTVLERLAFPAPIENKTQVILANGDRRLLSLRNMDTQLSLI